MGGGVTDSTRRRCAASAANNAAHRSASRSFNRCRRRLAAAPASGTERGGVRSRFNTRRRPVGSTGVGRPTQSPPTNHCGIDPRPRRPRQSAATNPREPEPKNGGDQPAAGGWSRRQPNAKFVGDTVAHQPRHRHTLRRRDSRDVGHPIRGQPHRHRFRIASGTAGGTPPR